MKDIEYVHEHGTFFGGRVGAIKVCYWSPDPAEGERFEKDDIKFAVSCSKKVSKRAVDRNRLKRQVRHIVQQWMQEGKVISGVAVMIMISPQALGASSEILRRGLFHVFQKAQLFR